MSVGDWISGGREMIIELSISVRPLFVAAGWRPGPTIALAPDVSVDHPAGEWLGNYTLSSLAPTWLSAAQLRRNALIPAATLRPAVLICFSRRHSRTARLQSESARPFACLSPGRSAGQLPISRSNWHQLRLGPLPGVVLAVEFGRTGFACPPAETHAVG
jgi:hypothetical protein